MQHELIPLNDPGRWHDALRGIEHAFGHTWESCYAMSLTTGHLTFLYHCEADEARIVCPLAERRFAGEVDIVTPYGFSGFTGAGTCAEFPAAWLSFARRQGWVCGYIALNPLLERNADWHQEDLYYRSTLHMLDLTLGEAELFSRLSRSRKRQIQAWAARGGSFGADRDALAEFLIAHSPAFFRSRGASSVYALTPETWRCLLALPNVEPIGAVQEDRIIGVTVFGFSSSIGDALFDVSLPEGRGTSPALLWEGVHRLRARGVSLLNLGGGVRDGDSVAQSKEQYRARKLPFHCLKQVYDAERFAALCRSAGVDPAERSGYFPPYRAPGAA